MFVQCVGVAPGCLNGFFIGVTCCYEGQMPQIYCGMLLISFVKACLRKEITQNHFSMLVSYVDTLTPRVVFRSPVEVASAKWQKGAD